VPAGPQSGLTIMTSLPSKLGIVAGGGLLPRRLVQFCDERGIEIFIVGFKDLTPEDLLAGRDHILTRIGRAGDILSALRERGIHDLVLIGSMKRPALASLNPDWVTAKFFGKILWRSLGDDGLLKAVRAELEKEGFALHGIHDLMDNLLMAEGPLGKSEPTSAQMQAIHQGFQKAKEIGAKDIGQSVVVNGNGDVLGIEDAHGTDDLIRRCAAKGAILVKAAKPQQDRKLDLPTIGSNTVRLCADLGYAGIAVESGSTLIADEEAARQIADEHGLFVMGVPGRKHIVLIAGEPSGDFLGGQLTKALRYDRPDIQLSGIGGPHMQQQGIHSLFPYEDLAVMGLAEVLPSLFKILGRIRQTVDYIKQTKPDVVVTIDAPDFCFRVVKALIKDMPYPPKFVHYVAPTVWAWRPKRAQKIAKFLDGLICLFDFEPPYFKAHHLKSVAVGHPLVEGPALSASGADFREEYGIAKTEPVIGVLFGSRTGELKRIGQTLRDAAALLSERIDGTVHVVAPTLPHVKDRVADLLKEYPGPIHIVTDPAEKWNAFASFDIALAVSGTVGLELAAMTVPHVIAYKANLLTAAAVRRLIRVRYIHLANIMENRAVVPEFVQENCTAEAIADNAYEIWLNPAPQKAALEDVARRIGAGQEKTPSEKAAAFVLSFLL